MNTIQRTELYKQLETHKLKFTCCLECMVIEACNLKKLDIARLIHSFGFKINYEYAFAQSCMNEYFDVAHWLLECGVDINVCNKRLYVRQHLEINVVEDSCFLGSITIIQWLIDNGANINVVIALRRSCECEKINLVQYLYDQGKITLHNIYWEFKLCCYRQQLEFSKELYTLWKIPGDIIIGAIDMTDNVSIVQWLISLEQINIVKVFTNSCKREKLDIANWLLENFPLVREHIDSALFKVLSKKIYLESAKWLYSLGANIYDKQIDKIFVMICNNINGDRSRNKLEAVKWLVEIDDKVFIRNVFKVIKITPDYGYGDEEYDENIDYSRLYEDQGLYEDQQRDKSNYNICATQGFSDDTISSIISLVNCFNEGYTYDEDTNKIDDVILYIMAHHNMIDSLEELRKIFDFFDYEINEGEGVNITIHRNATKLKSARSY